MSTNEAVQTSERTTTVSRTRRRRRLVTFAVGGAAALTLGLGACSGGAADTAAPAASSAATQLSAYEVVKASAEQSQEAGSAKFSLASTGSVEGTALELSGEGAFDAASGAFEMTMTLPAEAGGTTVALRVVDGVLYLSGAPLTAEGQWMQMPLDGMPGLDTTAMDPSAALQQLQAVADDVTEVPGVTVRGVETTGYTGTIDPAKAAESLPEAERPDPAELEAVGPIPFTLYVDAENRPARVVVEQSGLTVTMDYYDWGTDVDVAAPDPATVTAAPGMAGMPDAAAAESPAAA